MSNCHGKSNLCSDLFGASVWNPIRSIEKPHRHDDTVVPMSQLILIMAGSGKVVGLIAPEMLNI